MIRLLLVIATLIGLMLLVPKLVHSETISIAEVIIIEKHAKEKVEKVVYKAPQAPVSVVKGSCEDYRLEVEKYDWNVDIVMQIMKLESNCTPTAVNGTDNHRTCIGSWGLMQLGCFWLSKESSFDPVKNIAKAYEIYMSPDKNGVPKRSFKPWSTCRKIHLCQ